MQKRVAPAFLAWRARAPARRPGAAARPSGRCHSAPPAGNRRSPRATAGLDRQQGRHLHGIRIVELAVHRLRAGQQVGEGQVERARISSRVQSWRRALAVMRIGPGRRGTEGASRGRTRRPTCQDAGTDCDCIVWKRGRRGRQPEPPQGDAWMIARRLLLPPRCLLCGSAGRMVAIQCRPRRRPSAATRRAARAAPCHWLRPPLACGSACAASRPSPRPGYPSATATR